MKNAIVSRRKFFVTLVAFTGISTSIGSLISGCDSRKTVSQNTPEGDTPVHPCDDLSGVSETDLALREKLAYVSQSPIEDNTCGNCNLFLPPKGENSCGGCMLFKGPVHASGYCTYWAPKV